MEAKLERNREIYEAREGGVSFSELGRKYGVTSTCVKTIYEREKKKEELKQHKYYNILVSLTDNEEMITRTITVLERHNLNTDAAILNVTRKELLKCRNCGEVMTDLILQIHLIYQSILFVLWTILGV